MAKAIYGAGSDLAEQWAKQRRDELNEGKTDGCSRHCASTLSTTTRRSKRLDYVTRNQNRMRYPDFRTQGLCVSSGVVEACCNVAIGTRLKRSGMHWTVASANAIAAWRCCKLSCRFEGSWERRSATAAAGGR